MGIASIGAVIAGRRTYDDSVPWWGPDGPTGPARLPVFVVSHSVPAETPEGGVYTFVTGGIESALEQARAAAGEKDVTVMGGARTGQQFLAAGLVDELSLHVVPVLFGRGMASARSPAGNLRRVLAGQPSGRVSRARRSFVSRVRRAIVVVVAAAAVVGVVEVVPGAAEPAARSAAEARTALAVPQQLEARLLRIYDAFDANQGVGVDRSHFYAVDNTSITKHSRETGAPLLQFAGADGGPLIHMDSGAVHNGRLYPRRVGRESCHPSASTSTTAPAGRLTGSSRRGSVVVMTYADRSRRGARPASGRLENRPPALRTPAASVLRLQRRAGNSAVTRLLQRTPDFEHEIEIGTDVSTKFAAAAKKVARGKVDDAALLALHNKALEDDQSVGDAERMLMAALLVPANAKTVADARVARGAKLKLSFARAPASAANMRRIADLGRQTESAQVRAAISDMTSALLRGDLVSGGQAAGEVEKAANAQILELGKGDSRIKEVLAFADGEPNRSMRSDILAAMLAAGSDSTRGDMVLAAAVYVIAKAEGHPLADDVRAGKIKVDEVRKVPAPPGVTGVVAAYVTAGLGQREKGDTVYLSSNFQIKNLAHRALVVHELEHAKGDKSPPSAPASALDEEMKAFIAQAAYMLKSIDKLPTGQSRKDAVADIVKVWGPGWLDGAILASRKDPKTRSRLEDVIREINRKSTDPDKPDAALLDRMLADDAGFEAVARQSVADLEGIRSGDVKRYDKLRGESRLDWMGP